MVDWAVAKITPQSERKATESLTRHGLTYFFPRIKRTVRHRGKRVHHLDALFPGYLFLLLQEAWHEVFDMRGISGLIMAGENPAILRDEVITEIKSTCDRDGVYVPPVKPRFRVGDAVRVGAGPLAGSVGLYAGSAKEREAALFDLFGRKTRVEFKEGDLVAA